VLDGRGVRTIPRIARQLVAIVLIAATVAGLLPANAYASRSQPIDAPLRDELVVLAVVAQAAERNARLMGALTPEGCPGLTKTAFGELLTHVGSDPQPYAFAGEPLDPNSGFQYHRARWMDPSIGRFHGADPFEGLIRDPRTLHRYIYAANEPASLVDPTGRFASVAELSIANAIASSIYSMQITNGLDLIAEVGFKDNAAVQMGRVVVNAAGAVIGLSTLALSLTRSGLFARFLTRYGCSFSEDTPVWTADGEVPIGEITPGDLVWGFDQEEGTTGLFPVSATHVNEDPTVVLLTIDEETIETTPEHPFFTSNRGWVGAGRLEVGDLVQRAERPYGSVKRVELRGVAQRMFNLTVETAHTFFVGDGRWLVHNTCTFWGNPSSSVLTTRLINAGVTPPSWPNAAHHIVAGAAERAKPARDHLALLGFNSNDAANGVFLRTSPLGTGAPHRNLHSNRYYDEVNTLITGTKTREEALEVLADIAERLRQGTFPYEPL
jgi:RHS repeat-associated protein